MKTQPKTPHLLLAICLALGTACAAPAPVQAPIPAPTLAPVLPKVEPAPILPTTAPVAQPTAAPIIQPTAKPAETTPQIAPDQARYEAKVDVGGRSVFFACYGTGKPAIILDDVLGQNGSYFLNMYQPDLSQISRVCYYSKPNTINSQSDPVKDMRTSKDFVADLHTVLGKVGLKAPYVLVGGEFGAMNMTLYAAQYPKEAAGMVLVQPWRPFMSAILDLVPESNTSPQAKAFRDLWQPLQVGKYQAPGIDLDARIDVLASEKQVLEVKSLGDLPMFVIRGVLATQSAPDADVAAKMRTLYDEKLTFYTKLSSRMEVSDGMFSSKFLVVSAVQKLVDQARASK